ncbi:hypothetical protein ACFLZV_04355 [Candidatus Margulisiibacteriota bacterium]
MYRDIIILVSYFLFLAIMASTPVDIVVPWLVKKVRHIEAQLDKDKPNIKFSPAAFIFLLMKSLQFAKGYVAVFLTQRFFESEWMLLISISIVILFHNWTLFNKFKNRHHLFLVAWGIYSALYFKFFFIFPISYVLLSFLFNSFVIGILANIVFMFAAIWTFYLDPLNIILNLDIFLFGFLVYAKLLFKHFEETPYTLLKSFENRK